MNEITLRDIQIGSFNVLKRISEVFNEYNLNYYLFYGTLLGAIRHNGFIPWDDDIDIVMPRKDYEQMLQIIKNDKSIIKPYELIHYSTNKCYIYAITRISNPQYKLEFDNTRNYGLGLFIDIYPLDGMGDTEAECKKTIKKLKVMKFIAGICGMDVYKKSNKGLFRSLLKLGAFIVSRLYNLSRLLRKLDSKAKEKDFDKYKYVGCSCWAVSGPAYYEKSDFDEYIFVKFEGTQFRAPKNYDKILRETYGNYLELPPYEKRIAHHEYKAYIIDN